MFRLESYIAPLVMSYIDRYVKLKTEDFRMSLWSGAVTLHQLDLRLDAIEESINLPVKLSNGHIRELKIQVPWTKLGSEPVLIEIDTIECMLSIRNEDDASDAHSTSNVSSTPIKRPRSKKKIQSHADSAPGYVQSLLNRIISNVNIKVENLILKFVEADIVLSVNIKAMEIFSVNSDWKRSYVEISAPDFILRRLVEFSDLTVCLDKIDQANGKISNYQDPIIYRCSLQTRIYTKFDNLHTSMPNTTKVHTMCETLQLSLSDTQLPMFLRLLELAEAIYYGDVPTFSSVDPQTTSSAACQEDEPVTEGTGTQELCEESVGWASWAWSFVPPVLPSSQESDDSNNHNQDEPQESCAPSTPVFDISFYNKKATLVFKLSKSMKLSHKNFNSKVIFEPILELKMEGNALEILARGLLFLDVQFGISRTAIYAIGDCTCATNESSYQQDIPLLSAGSDDSKQNPRLDYLTGCLFDSSQHHGAISTYIFDYDKHCQKYKESWAVEKFGAVWINYLWIEETPNPETSGKETSGTDFKSIFVDEISYMKFWFHDLTLNYTSSMKHRLDRIILCASNHSYQPYAVKDEEIVDSTRPTPSQQQIDCFERFIPSKNIHLGFLRSRINVYPSTHCKAGNLSNASTGLERRFCLKLSAERLDFQSTGPMYPRKLIRLVSQLPQPSNNLVYHCQRHQNIKAMKFESRLVLLNKPFEDCIDPPIKDEKTLVLPLTAAYYRSVLLLPMYWSQRQFERYSVRMEILEGTFIFTLPQLMTVYSTTMSWTDDFEKQKLIGTSLVDDAFNTTSGQFSILDVSFNQFELKQSSTMCVNAAFGNLGSVCVTVITKDEESDDMLSATVFQAPVDTSLLNHRHLFTTSKSIDNCSSDFLCFTFQAPKGAKTLTDISSSDGEHSVLLFTMQGWALSADPMIMKCLHYKELVASTSHPLHALRSEGASTQLSTSTTEVNITSNADLKKLEEVKAKDLGDGSSSGSFDLHYLAILHNLSCNLSINVAVKSGCVFVPQKSLMTPAMGWQHSMPEQWRQLSYLQELPPSVVVCLPSITAKSSDVSLSAPIEDLPVPSSSGVSPSFPVTCAIENLSVYSHVQGGFPYLIEPASLVTTVSFNTQPLSSCASSGSQSPPTSLSLHISTVVDPTHCTISSTQIKLVLQLLTSWIDIIPLLLTRITVESAASKTAMLGNSCHSITSVTDEEATYNGVDTNSGSLYERAQTTSSTSTTSSSASQKSIKVVIKAPKLSLNMLLKEDGFKRHSLCAISEDISCNMDIYGEYAKVQLKIWSSELLHGYFDIRCEEFVAGPKHGLLLSSTQRFLNLQSCPVKLGTEVLNSRDVSQMMKDKPRDAFLNFTYTRASCQSLKQRLSLADSGDLLKEGQGTSGKLSGEMQGNRNYGVTAEPNHISELCIDLTQCDIICYMPVIADALEILLLDLAPAAKQLVSQVLSSSEVPHDKPKDASQAPTPWLHSRTLPLLHFTIGNFRLILPIDSQLDECHDVLVVGVHGVELTPQVDNPLPHLILDNQLYQQKIKKLNFHGSPVDNRQFQMDLHALGVFTGKWTQMKLEEKKSYYSSSENPAFEWNKIAQAEELKIAKLDPIVSPLNLKLQFAPAITYHKTTVCGHSAEVNVTSDVLLCLSDVHVNLMYLLSMELISFFKDILLSQQLEAAPASSTQKHSPKGKVSNKKAGMILDFVTMVTAVDVLLTARHISLSLIGDKGVNPIVRVTFTQPHTLLCTKPSSERLEISCYDMSISLGPSFVLNSKDNPLPHTGDFPESLLTSQLGLPDDKTGILPCLFTLKIKSILNKPEINIDIGRPVAISLSVETVESVRAALVSLIPDACRSRQNCAFSSQNPALQPESSTTKSSAKLDIQLLDTYPKFPINTLALTASKFKLSIEFRERQKVHFHMHHYSLTTSVMSSTDFDQLDIALRLAAVDIELIVSSPQLLNSRVLGPFSFTADVNSAISRIHVPFSNIRISSSVLPFQAGIENIEISTSCFAELSAIFVQKTELPPRSSGGNWISASVSNDPRRLSLDFSDYYDDLRMGAFKYLLEKERKLPVANTVLFYSDHDSSTLTWTYLQPRVISAIHINPIPFDYPVDPNAGFFLQDVQIGCSLEYWNLKSTSFTKYADFSISEQFGTSVSLPLVTSGLAVSSRTWRIVINYYLERNYCLDPVEDYVFAMVSPAVLVAAMKVDSKYAPSLVPILQVSLNVNQMRLNIASSHTLAAGHHEKLVHFDLKCEGDSYRQDIFSMLLDNTLLELGVWPCQLNNSLTSPSVKFQSSHSLTLRFCDLKHLVWKPMVALEDIKVDGSFATQGNQRCYALHVGIGKTEMTMSQDCINTILQLFSMFKQHTGGLQHLPLSYMYTMCNNTHVGLYVKQVSCDDNSAIHIPPGTAHPFCWNKYSPLQVQLSQDKGLHNWSSASALDDTGVHVTKIWNHVPFKDRDSNYVTLFIDVEKMTSVHKMVTISGSVCVTSRLSTTHLDIRLSTTEKHNFHMKIARSFSFSSFAISNGCGKELRVREVASKADDQHPYSQPIHLDHKAVAALDLFTVSLNRDMAEACCRVMVKHLEGESQYCVEFSPLYSIKSYLPHTLAVSVLPTASNWLIHTSCATELAGLASSEAYVLSLRPSESTSGTPVELPLSLNTFTSLEDVEEYDSRISVLDICRQSAISFRTSRNVWPDSSQNYKLDGKFQPLSMDIPQSVLTSELTLTDVCTENVGVEISWKQHWVGTASLLMTIKPQCVFVNNTSVNICIVYGSQFSPIQPRQTVISPNSLQTYFTIGIYGNEHMSTSDLIYLSEDDINPRSFVSANKCILFMESYAYTNIGVSQAQHRPHQLLYFVITSHKCDGVRVITVHERFIVHNSTKKDLFISALAAPICSSRVHPQEVTSHPVQLPCDTSMSLPLTTTQIIETASTAAVVFLTFSQVLGDWSYPFQLPIEQFAMRHSTLAVPLETSLDTKCLCLTLSTVNGVTYIVVGESLVPTIFLHNSCALPLAYGQTLTNRSEEVLEAMSLLSQPPVIKSMHSTAYTFTTVNKQYPLHVGCTEYPRLKIASTLLT